ncbi:hypothetical protein LCGC14_0866290 [marine sediment metagenome]|uniref:Uncharacterized protein n=1 Tax=marine sediment metagenome TaxID=412755 RepID=A0A0F9P605_9ZZZZ
METLSGIGKFVEEQGGNITAVAGAVESVAGAAATRRAEQQAGKIAEETAAFNASQFREQARVAIQKGSFEARKLLRLARKTTAANIAAVGATGGLLTGSKLLAIADTEAVIELDKRQLLRNAEIEARGFESQADIAIFGGQQLRAAANIRAEEAARSGFRGAIKGIKPAFQLAGALAAKLNKKPRALRKSSVLKQIRGTPLPAKLRRTNIRTA